MRCTLSTANITENASLPYVVTRRFSRYSAGSLLSARSRQSSEAYSVLHVVLVCMELLDLSLHVFGSVLQEV